jgi:hypothetical protein
MTRLIAALILASAALCSGAAGREPAFEESCEPSSALLLSPES